MSRNNYEVGYFLRRNASVYPDRSAVIFGDISFSYKELNLLANRIGNHLLELGVKKGDRIGYLFRNGVESVIVWHCAQKIGATAVPINTAFLEPELAYVLQVSQCKALFYHADFQSRVSHVLSSCPDLLYCITTESGGGKNQYDLQAWMKSGLECEPDVEIHSEDESLMLFTSGTTGKPKAVVRTQKMVREYAMMLAIDSSLSERDRNVTITHLRLYHTGGWLNMMRMVVLAGTLIMIDRVEPEKIFRQIEQHQATHIFMLPPVVYNRLYESELWKTADLSSVKMAYCSGGKCSYDYAMNIFKMFPNAVIRFSYGSTETCTPLGASLTREEIIARPELACTAGKLGTLCEIRLVDDMGNDVPQGEAGEALIRSAMIFRGYANRPDLNATVFNEEGWFHTEDIMRRSEDGFFFIVDRKRDMIKTGGENVYAQEVESVLRNHPAIFDCAAIGIPDAKFGEAIAVAIVVEKAQRLDPEEFLAYCAAHMENYKKPRYWAFMEELPVNSIGKIQKSILRQHPELFLPVTKK